VSFADVVRRRRMTRAFRPDPLPPGLLDDLVDLAARSPSAGKAQGWHLVVLEGDATSRFWDITLPADRRPTFRWQQLLDAPVIAVVLADPQAYVDRYAEPDKAATGLGGSADAWPAPYWTVDAAMATMALLLAAEDAGLGALFFGVFRGEPALRTTLSIPERIEVIGALALGYRDESADQSGRSARRPRRPAAHIVHRDVFTDG
jgi:nitroreductase